MTVDAANKQAHDQLEILRITAERLGFNKTQIRAMIAAYEAIPKKAMTEVTAPGLSPTLQHAISLNHYFDELDGRRIVSSVVTEFREYRAGERDLSRRASGGPVMAGSSYWVGENGPEIVSFGRDGTVIPAGKSAAMAGGGGTSRIELYIYGDDAEFVRKVRRNARILGNGNVQMAFGES
jgi:hypothetical protein